MHISTPREALKAGVRLAVGNTLMFGMLSIIGARWAYENARSTLLALVTPPPKP